MESTDKIREMVAQRRTEAEKLGLDKALFAIYNMLFKYDGWSEQRESYLPGSISDVTIREAMSLSTTQMA